MIEANGVELATGRVGDAEDPPILLVMGIGASMLWWEDGFCRMLVEGGRLVIRYDHRDTGRSVTYEVGRPGYTGADLVADAVGVLDAYGIQAAHVVGVSAGGAFAQLLALTFPTRVLSLVLISTSPATPGERPASAGGRALSSVPGDRGGGLVRSGVGHRLSRRPFAGARRRRAALDEAAARELVGRDVERARNIAASENHAAVPEGVLPQAPLSSIAVPTLVIHGTADPMFPLEHGQALAEEVPGARLLTLTGAATALIAPTGRPSSGRSSAHRPDREETLMEQPVTELDTRFSDQDAVATDWKETRRALEDAELFWISTVRADGRPHVTPLVAVWRRGAI